MATARYPDGRVVDFDGSAELARYYEDDGATVDGGPTQVTLPRTFELNDEGEQVEQLPDGQLVEMSAELEHVGTGEPMTEVSVPQNSDGSWGPAEVSNDPAPDPSPEAAARRRR